MKPVVLVVEDDSFVLEIIESNLSLDGWKVVTEPSGTQAVEAIKQVSPDVVVLDIMLKGGNGLEVCRQVRDSQDETIAKIPILMLTALATQSDKLNGFSVGADDYLTKPFDPRELDARLKALLKRTQNLGTTEKKVIRVGSLQLDPNAYVASYTGEVISLKPQEFDLLFALAQKPGHVFSRQDILEQVWGYSYPVDSRTVDIHISRLRQKLKEVNEEGEYLISTIYGVGYKLEYVA